jgi:hypothetical protein
VNPDTCWLRACIVSLPIGQTSCDDNFLLGNSLLCSGLRLNYLHEQIAAKKNIKELNVYY